MKPLRAVIIGASAGGVTAIQKLLEALPRAFTTPIVVVQHLPPDAQLEVALVFSRTGRNVFEGTDKTPIEPGAVYFAPPAYHLLIERDLTLSLSQDEPVHFARPSIDVTFESAAQALGDAVCGVLLTGANADGATGLHCIAGAGGVTMVQSLDEAECGTMPGAALQLFTPSFVGSLTAIAGELVKLQVRGGHD